MRLYPSSRVYDSIWYCFSLTELKLFKLYSVKVSSTLFSQTKKLPCITNVEMLLSNRSKSIPIYWCRRWKYPLRTCDTSVFSYARYRVWNYRTSVPLAPFSWSNCCVPNFLLVAELILPHNFPLWSYLDLTLSKYKKTRVPQ